MKGVYDVHNHSSSCRLTFDLPSIYSSPVVLLSCNVIGVVASLLSFACFRGSLGWDFYVGTAHRVCTMVHGQQWFLDFDGGELVPVRLSGIEQSHVSLAATVWSMTMPQSLSQSHIWYLYFHLCTIEIMNLKIGSEFEEFEEFEK